MSSLESVQDWRAFQDTFQHAAPGRPFGTEALLPAFFVVDGEIIVSAYAEHEDLREWIGSRQEEVLDAFPHREMYFFSLTEVEEWLSTSREQPNFYQQVQYLKHNVRAEKAAAAGAKKKSRPMRRVDRTDPVFMLRQSADQHFLLRAIRTWWASVLPSSFGVFLRIDDEKGGYDDFFLLIRRGEVDSFLSPDLSALPKGRSLDVDAVVRFLAERFAVKVQGLVVRRSDWESWSKETDPWRRIAKAIRDESAQLVPFRWSIATLMATRGFLGV